MKKRKNHFSDNEIQEILKKSLSRLKKADKKGVENELSQAKFFLTKEPYFLRMANSDKLYSEYWKRVSESLNRNIDENSIRGRFNPD